MWSSRCNCALIPGTSDPLSKCFVPWLYKNSLGDEAYMWSHIGPMIITICLGLICGDISKVFVIMDQVSLHVTLIFPHLDFSLSFFLLILFFFSLSFLLFFFGLKVQVQDSHSYISFRDFGPWWQLPLTITLSFIWGSLTSMVSSLMVYPLGSFFVKVWASQEMTSYV